MNIVVNLYSAATQQATQMQHKKNARTLPNRIIIGLYNNYSM